MFSVFYISRVFSNARSVLSQCNTRPRLLHLLYDIDVMWWKTIKHAFSIIILYSDKTSVFDQSECAQGLTYVIIANKLRHNIVKVAVEITSCRHKILTFRLFFTMTKLPKNS